MEYIKNYVKIFAEKTGIGRKKPEDVIVEKWPDIAGEDFALSTRPFKMTAGKLFVYADNSVVMNELIYKKKELKKKINAMLHGLKIEEIIIRLKQ